MKTRILCLLGASICTFSTFSSSAVAKLVPHPQPTATKAVTRPEECRFTPPHVKIIPIDQKNPSYGYWMNAIDNDRVTAGDRQGRWVGLNSKKHGSTQSKRFDPVPTPDGKFIVHPNPVQFYSTDEYLKNPDQQPPLSNTTLMGAENQMGYYHSVGLLKKSKDQNIYRVLTAQGNGLIQDYAVNFLKNPPTLQTIGHPILLCANIQHQKALSRNTPKLSLDGKMVAFEEDSGDQNITRIYAIRGNGDCELISTAGQYLSKVQFDHVGRDIAYTSPVTAEEAYQLSLMSGNTIARIQNIKSGRSAPILAVPPDGSGTLIQGSPTFFPNGKLGIQMAYDSSSYPRKEFWIVDPNAYRIWYDYSVLLLKKSSQPCPECSLNAGKPKTFYDTLSQVLSGACHIDSQNKMAITIALANLSLTDCLKLTDDFFDSLAPNVRKHTSKTVYQAACRASLGS